MELGIKFRSELDGWINGIRFYKGPRNTGAHVGSLWNAAGQLLAQATFANESASGWQEVLFDVPVAITADTVYVASYHTEVGFYSGDTDYFAASGVDNPPLHALRDGESGGNGVYLYGSGGFPIHLPFLQLLGGCRLYPWQHASPVTNNGTGRLVRRGYASIRLRRRARVHQAIYDGMSANDLAVVSLLADMGNGEVQDPVKDLPRVNGQDDPISTPGRIVHWDAEWHWDATYTQYEHQALGGHVFALGLSEAHQIWEEYTYPIFQWAEQQNGIAGFAHMQYLGDTIPQTLDVLPGIPGRSGAWIRRFHLGGRGRTSLHSGILSPPEYRLPTWAGGGHRLSLQLWRVLGSLLTTCRSLAAS